MLSLVVQVWPVLSSAPGHDSDHRRSIVEDVKPPAHIANKVEWKMIDRDKQDPDALLMEEHAARLLNLSVRTLQSWRLRGDGPAYVRAGRAIRYRRGDIISWISANTVTKVKNAPVGQ